MGLKSSAPKLGLLKKIGNKMCKTDPQKKRDICTKLNNLLKKGLIYPNFCL